MVAFEAGRSILGRVPCHQAESFTTLSASHTGVSPTVVLEIPAVKASAAVPFDGEVPLGCFTAGGAPFHPSALCCWLHTRDRSILDGSRERISLAGVVVANESKGKRDSKIFEGCLPEGDICGWPEILHQDEGVYDTTIKQKPKHIAVEFPCLATDPVVLPELVCLVHASHKLIVFNNTGRTWNLLDTAITFSPLNCGVSFWMAVRRHEVYQLPVSPHTGHQIVSLTGHGLASLQVTWIWYVYSIATCMCSSYIIIVWELLVHSA